jgi:hypothetical protein
VEDDHVDRPGVEVRQRMKLTGTNSSIGLIILITHAHRDAMVCMSSRMSAAFGRYPPDRARHQARRPVGLAGVARRSSCSVVVMAGKCRPRAANCAEKTRRTKSTTAFGVSTPFATRYSPLPPQLLDQRLCASSTWWLWRGGCTRSHSEHGRETPQR